VGEMHCDELAEVAGELACGVAGAEDRARALDHLARCASCRRDVRSLGEVADGLASLAPVVQPPAGFESRVVAALGVAGSGAGAARPGPPSPAGSGHRRIPTGLLLQAAAVVLLAAVIGLGGWAIGRSGRSAATAGISPAPHLLVAAVLQAGGQPVGQVVMSAAPDRWLSMAVDADLGASTVRCEVVDHGHVVTLGSFSVAGGYGYWATSVPVDPGGITGVRLVTADGHVVARATLGGAAG